MVRARTRTIRPGRGPHTDKCTGGPTHHNKLRKYEFAKPGLCLLSTCGVVCSSQTMACSSCNSAVEAAGAISTSLLQYKITECLQFSLGIFHVLFFKQSVARKNIVVFANTCFGQLDWFPHRADR